MEVGRVPQSHYPTQPICTLCAVEKKSSGTTKVRNSGLGRDPDQSAKNGPEKLRRSRNENSLSGALSALRSVNLQSTPAPRSIWSVPTAGTSSRTNCLRKTGVDLAHEILCFTILIMRLNINGLDSESNL